MRCSKVIEKSKHLKIKIWVKREEKVGVRGSGGAVERWLR